MEPETLISPVINPIAKPGSMYRVLYCSQCTELHVCCPTVYRSCQSPHGFGLASVRWPHPPDSCCSLIVLSSPSPSPSSLPYFPIHQEEKKIYKKDCRQTAGVFGLARRHDRSNSGPPSKIARVHSDEWRIQERSTPLSRFFFLLTGGQPAFPRTDIPVRKPHYPMASHPLTSSACRRMGEMGGSTCAEADPSVALLPTLQSTMYRNGYFNVHAMLERKGRGEGGDCMHNA
ncbi:hypothetical protein GGI43DRAFT_258475 [Trichoderma evansii]